MPPLPRRLSPLSTWLRLRPSCAFTGTTIGPEIRPADCAPWPSTTTTCALVFDWLTSPGPAAKAPAGTSTAPAAMHRASTRTLIGILPPPAPRGGIGRSRLPVSHLDHMQDSYQ